jgi:hypothetical protein
MTLEPLGVEPMALTRTVYDLRSERVTFRMCVGHRTIHSGRKLERRDCGEVLRRLV